MKTMRIIFIMTLLSIITSCKWGDISKKIKIDQYPAFQSAYVDARQIEVVLPIDYNPSVTYDVLYMHDGQNVFNAGTAFAGVAWDVHKRLVELRKKNKIRPVILVAIWNTPNRLREYMPNQPEGKVNDLAIKEGWTLPVLSDDYLKFLVKELKPFIDETYSTNPQSDGTYIMGSSMGGLISLYALTEYPEVFGGAGCLSTHWPALEGVFLDYLVDHLPGPGKHKLYFDFGTATLDKEYEPYQQKVDTMMAAKGFEQGKNWITKKFEGAEHSEVDWAKRVHIPLEFLLSNTK
jgi:predicted alpha/beta superfamily hydrolase